MCKYLLIAITFLVLALPVYAADNTPCPRDDAYQAETTIGNLKSWDDVYRHYKRYGACDDGAISEGYSDTVGRLLSKDWDDVAKLENLCEADMAFERFTFKHLDMTIPADLWDSMMINATKRCPAEAKRVCVMIRNANDNIEKEIRQKNSKSVQTEPKHNVVPAGGYVPDEETAILIAVAVWNPIYGKETILKEKPFKARLENGIWYVSGSLPKGWVKGGVAVAEIVKSDGRIIRVSHGK
jgi:hypothetical protein